MSRQPSNLVASLFPLPRALPRRRCPTPVLLSTALGGLLALASCHPAPTSDGQAAPRCEAVEVLPGAQPFPAALAAAIASSPVPAQAPGQGPRPCNRLALEQGSFARQHAVDPVDWRPWSAQALADSALLHRPLFVLDGFAASGSSAEFAGAQFADTALATMLNRAFVPVIVDRDERPDVDAYLMEAVTVMTGGGGWPAAVFVDTDARPFEACSWGASAAPCVPLAQLVDRVQRRIALGSGSFATRADLTAEKMQKRATLDASGPLPDAKSVCAALRASLAGALAHGEFGEPPLFPRAPALAFLLGRRDDAEAVAMAVSVLDAMQAAGMQDGDGGFFRYAAKPKWQEPAREKMLADNAVLLPVLLQAAAATGRDDLRAQARRLAAFLVDRLSLDSGAFAVAIGADGRRDERVLADANALAVRALLEAGRVLGDERFTQAAVRAATFVDANLRRQGRMQHAWNAEAGTSGDAPAAPGFLSDGAQFALACLDLDAAKAPGGSRWIDAAREISTDLVRRFEHGGSGGFFQVASDGEQLPLRLKPGHDAAVPCGNSAAALLFTRLAARGTADAAAVARRTFESFSEPLTLRPMALPAMVSALDEWASSHAADAAPKETLPAVR